MHIFQVACSITILLLIQISNIESGVVIEQFGTCNNDNNCYPWHHCIDNKCIRCAPVNSMCNGEDDSTSWDCCKGTTCEPIPGFTNPHCRPNQNNCTHDNDCGPKSGLSCLKRIGKCGLCRDNGELCTLVNDTKECCSGFCDISATVPKSKVGIMGRCVDLFMLAKQNKN